MTSLTSIRVPRGDSGAPRDTSVSVVALENWFISELLGLGDILSREPLWEGNDSEVREVIAAVEDQLYALMNEVAVSEIEDVQLLPDGTLQKMVDGNWVDAGQHPADDISAANAVSVPYGNPAAAQIIDTVLQLDIPEGQAGSDGTTPFSSVTVTSIPFGQAPTAQIIGGVLVLHLPSGEQGEQGIAGQSPSGNDPIYYDPIADEARFCYAAHRLAEKYVYDLKHIISLMDAINTTVAGTAKDMIDAVTDGIPMIIDDVLIDTPTSFAYNALEAALEYLLDNLDNQNVIDQLAEFFYCAMIRAIETDGNYDQLQGHLVLAIGEDLYNIASSVVNGEVEIDFGTVLNAMLDATDYALAILVASYAWATQTPIVQLAKLASNWDFLITAYQSWAEHFDDRDCAAFNCPEPTWCYEFDFTLGEKLGWDTYLGRGVWTGVGFDAADYDVGQDGVWVKLDFAEQQTITKVTVEFDIDPVENDGTLAIYAEGDDLLEIWSAPTNHLTEGSNQTRTWEGTKLTNTIYPFIRASSKVAITGTATIKRIIIEGAGTNPIGEDNC